MPPAKAAQKDTQARWTVKTGRRRNPTGAQRRMPDIAVPVFGYKNHIVNRRTIFKQGRSAALNEWRQLAA